MGQLLSWIRATRDNQALQDVAVEQQSQPRQYSPTSVAQVAVNPAQFESASAASTMATKPGAVSVTMGGATASGATAGGSPTTAGTTQRGTAKVAMPETALVSPAGATIIDIPTPGTKGSPKDTPKPAPMHPAKATPPTTGGGNIVGEATTPWKAEVPKLQESLKQTAKSVPTTSSKVDMAKKDPAQLVTAVAAPAAAAGNASLKGPQTKVQVEVVPPGAMAAKEELAVDPFDALADSLPSSESFAPAAHVYTGPEVIEHGLTSKKGVICGGKDCPLPPGYRFEDMAPVADVKPKDVPKPMSTDEALDSLSFGFTTSMAPIPQKQEKKVEDLGAIDALSAGFSNFAPPPPAPIKKSEEFKSAPVTKSPAPPVDKKAKVEKFADDFSLMSGLDSPLDTKPKTDESVPTTSSKVDMAKKDPAKLVTAVAAPAAAAGNASLKGPQTKVQVEVVPPGAMAAKEPAPMHPAKATPPTTGGGNIVGEATTPWKAEVPKLQESLKQTAKSVPTTSSKVDMAKKDPAQLVTAVAAPAAAAGNASLKGPQTKVQVEVVPPGAMAAKEELAVDPFDALADSLPSSESFAPAAHVYTGPEVIEHGLTSKKGVICGGKDCPLPPGYRFEDMAPVADVKPKDVPKPMSTDEALDSLSFGFTTSMAPIPQKQEKKVEDLGAIDALSAGFSNFAPPPPTPIKKSEEFKSAPVTKSPAPPVDKKAKVEKFADDFSLMSGLDSPLDTKPKTDESVPTTSIKVDMAKKDPAKLVTAVAAPAAAAGDASLKGPQTKVQVEVVPPGAMAAKEPAPMHPAKATPPTTGGGNIVGEATTPWKAEVPKLQESLKQTAKSVPTTSSKVDMAKKDPAQLVTAVAAPAAAAGNASLKGPQTKVQVEVVPPGAMAAKEELAVDPFDALADSLPSSESFAPAAHVYTGPEVIEHGLTSKKGVICGGKDCPLPPGYRFEDMAPVADVKPKDVPKPMSTDEALDSLSFGFTTSMAPIPQKQEKKVEDLGAIDALSAGFSNFAPPPPTPIKKSEEFKSAPVTKSPAPPVDKKAKVEKFADDFSLMSGLDSPLDTKPKTDEGGSMSLDALSALGDSLPALEPAPEPPKIRHEDIVTEGKLTSKKGVFVGERDDTLPPKYRLTENKVKDLPPLKPEPSMDSGEALEILSGDFMSSCVAPAVQAPVLCPPAPPTQASDDFALDALAGDFVAPAVAPAVKSAVDRQLSRGTVDALDTLSDSLMDKTPIPEPAPVSVRDIVKEKKIMEEKLTKVGERDSSLPAEYRPTEKDRKAMAEAKVQADVRPKQPSMDDSEALDLLSRDLSFSAGPAAASVAVTTEQRQPRLEPMSAPVLDDLAGTLLPDTPEFKSKGDKPKSKSKSRSKSKKQREEDPSSIDHLSGQLSSDVVSASTNKGGKS
ncbi:calpastatin isoform X16 [Salvelinus namaycush]|uniref:Calpastatin n=1 Tax=Salvelinus namaycush TaxID=8040 RepID=A0A8U1H6J0_SALNM|nr:calpastatin isoform X16 [Salvelinus namaycush]